MENKGIDLSSLPFAECCENYFFESIHMYKKVSSFVSQTRKEENIRIDIIVCKKCKKIPDFVWKKLPSFLINDIPDEYKPDTKDSTIHIV